MNDKFKEYSHKFVKRFFSLLGLSLISLILGILFLLKNSFVRKNSNHKNIGIKLLFLSLGIFIFTYVYFCVIPFEVPKELDIFSEKDKNYSIHGKNTWVNINKENNIVDKKLKSLYLKDQNYELINIYSKIINLFSCRYKDKICLLQLAVFSTYKYLNWETIKIRESLCKECDFFVKTYDLNESDCSWKEEYIPYSLKEFKELNKNNIKLQLLELDKYLEKKDLYILDFHDENIRLTKDGKIKIIDGEICNKEYFQYFQYLQKINLLKPLPSFKRLSQFMIDGETSKYYK